MGILDTFLCIKGIKRYNSKLLYWQGDVNIWNGHLGNGFTLKLCLCHI